VRDGVYRMRRHLGVFKGTELAVSENATAGLTGERAFETAETTPLECRIVSDCRYITSVKPELRMPTRELPTKREKVPQKKRKVKKSSLDKLRLEPLPVIPGPPRAGLIGLELYRHVSTDRGAAVGNRT